MKSLRSSLCVDIYFLAGISSVGFLFVDSLWRIIGVTSQFSLTILFTLLALSTFFLTITQVGYYMAGVAVHDNRISRYSLIYIVVSIVGVIAFSIFGFFLGKIGVVDQVFSILINLWPVALSVVGLLFYHALAKAWKKLGVLAGVTGMFGILTNGFLLLFSSLKVFSLLPTVLQLYATPTFITIQTIFLLLVAVTSLLSIILLFQFSRTLCR